MECRTLGRKKQQLHLQRRATLRLAEGSAWYRSQHFDQSSAAYSEALREGNESQRARAHSGMGNSLFELGWRELSEQPYQGSDKQAPDMARFDKLVEKLHQGGVQFPVYAVKRTGGKFTGKSFVITGTLIATATPTPVPSSVLIMGSSVRRSWSA